MQMAFLVGETIYLRSLARSDLSERYLGWLNDLEVTRFLETGAFPSTIDDLRQFYEGLQGDRGQVMLAIADKATDQHIGNVKLGPINWVHRKAAFGILVGERTYWGRGVGAQATRLMVEYGFFRLNLQRVDLGVYAEHEAAVRCYERVGFKIEGRLRADLFQEGRYHDRLWMGLLREEYNGAGAL